MKNLAIIPARGGSKGLKNKNILKFNNKPLLAWSIIAAKKSKLFSKIIVSTDSKKISVIAKKYGAEVPFLRPKKLSLDKSKSVDLVIHALDFYKMKNIFFKNIFLLEPTSPLRDENDIINSYNYINQKKIKTLVSVSEINSQHPNYLSSISKKKKLVPYFKKFKQLRRQDNKKLYFLDGNIYFSCTQTLYENKSFYHNQTFAFNLPYWKSFEIDNLSDFKITELIHKNKGIFRE